MGTDVDAKKRECLAKLPVSTKYQVILADPPWAYRGTGTIQGKMTYPTMTLQHLKDLPVKELADTTSVLFMWATGPLFDKALEVMAAWGFQYKTVFLVWTKRDSADKPSVGCGWWSRPSTEFLLCGTKGVGYMRWKQTNSQPQELKAKRMRHSAKPPETRDIVKNFFAVEKRIELFARDRSPGWDAWGLDTEGYFASE